MPSDKCNSIMAKATGLIISLFNVALSVDVPFGILQYIKCTHHGTYFCPPLCHFADSPRCRLAAV